MDKKLIASDTLCLIKSLISISNHAVSNALRGVAFRQRFEVNQPGGRGHDGADVGRRHDAEFGDAPAQLFGELDCVGLTGIEPDGNEFLAADPRCKIQGTSHAAINVLAHGF